MTQAIGDTERDLTVAFPGIRFGRYNCRPKASGAPSQHAFDPATPDIANARDLFAPKTIHATPDGMAFLDDVYAYIISRLGPLLPGKHNSYFPDVLSIRVVLWRIPAHWTHIHIAAWPYGVGTPRCMSGEAVEAYEYSDGSRYVGIDPPPEVEPIPPGGGDLAFLDDDAQQFLQSEYEARVKSPVRGYEAQAATSQAHDLEFYREIAAAAGISGAKPEDVAAWLLSQLAVKTPDEGDNP